MKKSLLKIVIMICVITFVIACKTNKAGCYYGEVMIGDNDEKVRLYTHMCQP